MSHKKSGKSKETIEGKKSVEVVKIRKASMKTIGSI